MKKTKFGKIELSSESFDSEAALLRVSLMLPLNLIKELKRLSLNEKHSGKYQVLVRDILSDWVEKQRPSRKRKSS